MTGTLLVAPTCTADVQELVRQANSRSTPLRIRGGGSWMGAGAPVTAAETVALGRLSGIVDYVPGDLTLTARAATPLSEIASLTRAEGQWLALDPPGSEHASVGATVATASSGPLASAFGGPRDAVLGVEVVTGTGRVVRGGGRVVKNVAGFDLCRLFTGAWGTLGIITEVTVRLRALPEAERSCAVALHDGAIDRQLVGLRHAPFTAHAAQLLSGELAARLGIGEGPLLLLRLGGNSDALAAQERIVATLGEAAEIGNDVWHSLRSVEPLGASVVRLSAAPARLSAVWATATSIAAAVPGALLHACAGRGIARMVLPHEDAEAVDQALAEVERCGFVVVPERLPPHWWMRLRARGSPCELSSRVRAAFDPAQLLNRGILGEAA